VNLETKKQIFQGWLRFDRAAGQKQHKIVDAKVIARKIALAVRLLAEEADE
jgi:hypothetical protein